MLTQISRAKRATELKTRSDYSQQKRPEVITKGGKLPVGERERKGEHTEREAVRGW